MPHSASQKQASALTGLGEKNISRWLNGHGRASESAFSYLRLKNLFPTISDDVFRQWMK